MNKRDYLAEYLRYIPGSQTLSKNHRQYVVGVTPPVLSRGKGAYVWDNEGVKYLDLMLALGPMIFGYAHERIDRAVKAQIDLGTIYSLPGEPELILAKLIRDVVPCGEMSRFLLNGNDVTSGAVRLARHITGRDHVAKCGYHGWQDWSVAGKAGRNTGIPEVVKKLTHDFVYNDLASLQRIFVEHPGEIAAVILEPASSEKPAPGFLEAARDLAHEHGALFIFDEMVTGFRWALGGAQEFFGVVPDLACFGKAISNGYPVAVLAGKSQYMERMDEIFVSTTFGGYLPGVVAAIETITLMKELGNVHHHMHELGDYLIKEGNNLAQAASLPLRFVGYGPHPVLTVSISDERAARIFKTYLYQEMNRAGILFSTSLMIGYVHTREQIDMVLKNFRVVCERVSGMKDFSQLERELLGDIMAPRSVRAQQ